MAEADPQRAGGIPRELGAFEGPRPLRILCMDGGGTKGYTISTIMRGSRA